MSDMMFDQQLDTHIGFGEATVNIRTSAKPAALRHEPSSRAQLVCQWHRSAQEALTCSVDAARRRARIAAAGSREGGSLHLRIAAGEPTAGSLALDRDDSALTSAALGTFMCFVTEPGDLL